MEINLKVSFSDDEIRDFLNRKGYNISFHETNSDFIFGSGPIVKIPYRIECCDDGTEYKKKFEILIKENIKNILLQ